jgi:hypothetical protein
MEKLILEELELRDKFAVTLAGGRSLSPGNNKSLARRLWELAKALIMARRELGKLGPME